MLAWSSIVFILTGWTFLVFWFMWPLHLAKPTFLLSIFVAPALAYAGVRQLMEQGWKLRLIIATILSVASTALFGLWFYFAMYGRP